MSGSTAPTTPTPSSPLGASTPATTVYSDSVNMKTAGSTFSNGNGNDQAESSQMAGINESPAQDLKEYIFAVGFHQQQWTDIHLTFFGGAINLHRIILSRSPYLAHLMRDVAPGSVKHLNFTDVNVSEEAVYICLQHLYNPSQHLVNPANSRSVLATSYLFFSGSYDSALSQYAYTICRDSLSENNVVDYIRWLSATDLPEGFERADYGEFSGKLQSDTREYLVQTLPSSQIPPAQLIQLYARLPFDLFKSSTESPDFPIHSMQERFAFAKKVVAQRKKLSGVAGPGQMEESVVLAVGGEGMEVHITRKQKRRTALWKVEG
ncbi:hypothetical protein P7C73_g5441, partial [Tremellales sp. Uapishka_1]